MHFVQDVEIMNWFAAQVYCNALNPNAFLAEIFSDETQLVVAALASELPSYVWWLGATDFYKEGTWMWSKTNTEMEFSAWDEGQPSNDMDNEDCLIMNRGNLSEKRLWDDVSCTKNLGKPLCQIFPM